MGVSRRALPHAPPFICEHLFFRRITWANGDEYVGEVKDGKINGKGKYTWSVGDVYEGEWNDGKLHGQGIMTYRDGRREIGTWQDGTVME